MWNIKDFGNSDFGGDVFAFAGHCYNKDTTSEFPELLQILDVELKKLKELYENKFNDNDWLPSNNNLTKKEDKQFFIETVPFTNDALEYLKQGDITEEILNRNHVVQIARFCKGSGQKVEKCRPGELLFGYVGDGYVKVYRPALNNFTKTFFWLGNAPQDYVFGLDCCFDNDILILAGGEKDVLTWHSKGYNAFCLFNELTRIPYSVLEDLHNYFHNLKLIVVYDIDETGLREGKKRSIENNIPHVILPDTMRQSGGKDIFDHVKSKFPFEPVESLISEAIKSEFNFESSSENFEKANNANNSSDDNSFPIEVLPNIIREIITEANLHAGHHIDYMAGGILAVTSSAIGRIRKVKVKEGWYESSLVYLTFLGRAGISKTPTLKFVIKPLVKSDKLNFQNYLAKKKEFDKLSETHKKGKSTSGSQPLEKPIRLRTLVSDITIEALVKDLSENPAGIALFSDELAGWIKDFDRFKKGGSEQQRWLSIWSGAPIYVDRITRDPILISEPYVTVFGGIQPYVLREIGMKELVRNGFMDRILFVTPIDAKKPHLVHTNFDPKVEATWERIIFKLLEQKYSSYEIENDSTKILSLTPEAFQAFSDWHRYNTDICNNEENEILSGVQSKLDMYVIRLALILQMLYWACDEGDQEEIDERSLEGAIKLIEYFRKTAIQANSIMTNSNPLSLLTKDKQKLYNELPKRFTYAEARKLASQQNPPIPVKTLYNFLILEKYFDKPKRDLYEKKL